MMKHESTNDEVIKLIKGRLDMGQETYGQDIPIRGENGRDNLKESIEEVLDLSVYLGATLLELEVERTEALEQARVRKIYKLDVSDIKLVLQGLHKVHQEAYSENQLKHAENVLDLINGIKATSKWCHSDDDAIGQISSHTEEMKKLQGAEKCIPGSNCD